MHDIILELRYSRINRNTKLQLSKDTIEGQKEAINSIPINRQAYSGSGTPVAAHSSVTSSSER